MVMQNSRRVLRVAAVGDVHCPAGSSGILQPLLEQMAASADVLALCGDLTDHGLPDEARALARELTAAVKLPVLAVLGNHDYESNHVDEVRNILCHEAGVHFLDGESHVLHGVGFAGCKGFGGGFGRGTLSGFGEPAIKRFVQEAIDEALKLEAALVRLEEAHHRIAILHYSPIRATVEGEPPEIFPYLGSSRLEEPINRYGVNAVVHGHAHRGAPEGQTSTGVPVYNVSVPVMKHSFPDRPPFRVLSVPLPDAPPARDEAHAPTASELR
jgi:Icc-related predicted phosphoesterase